MLHLLKDKDCSAFCVFGSLSTKIAPPPNFHFSFCSSVTFIVLFYFLIPLVFAPFAWSWSLFGFLVLNKSKEKGQVK